MTQADGHGCAGFVIFRDDYGGADGEAETGARAEENSAHYFHAREQAELAAARSARSAAARRAHSELAKSYARQLERMRGT